MTLEAFEDLLLHPAALTAAHALSPTSATFLACFEKLRKRFPEDLVKAALETAILRHNAAEKFPDAARLYFQREALEQATHYEVARHRAQRMALNPPLPSLALQGGAGGGFLPAHAGVVSGKVFTLPQPLPAKPGRGVNPRCSVLDLGCGLGADSIALAQAGCEVVAVELDPLRAAMAEANFRALGLGIPVLRVDALTADYPETDAIFCDPARREGANRFLDTERYSPSPQAVMAKFAGKPICFKLAPGIAHRDLAQFEGEAEFVSLHGELKECCLWIGFAESVHRRATLLPSATTLTAAAIVHDREITEAAEYIHLPDVAIIRAQLEPQLALLLGATFLDATQPFLTSTERTMTPLARAYRHDGTILGNVGKLTAALRERKVGRVTWRNFGSPREVEAVRRAVKLNGEAHRVVILTKLAEAAAAIILEPLEA